MCGVFGVSGVPDAARLAYMGLYALQHRGQESAGIVSVYGQGHARAHRGMGLVSENFSEANFARLVGDVAVGHTRYSTAGSSVLANAQPFLIDYRNGPLTVAHNGNLTNAQALRGSWSSRARSSTPRPTARCCCTSSHGAVTGKGI